MMFEDQAQQMQAKEINVPVTGKLFTLQRENFCSQDKNYGIYGKKYPLRTNIELDRLISCLLYTSRCV